MSRRVDLSKQIREVLMGLRDTRLLAAMMNSKTSIADELVFPSHVGTVLKPDNIAPRYMEPALEKAGLRRLRFHDLRHTFGSLMIQDGAALAYVKEQMGHASIQIAVDRRPPKRRTRRRDDDRRLGRDIGGGAGSTIDLVGEMT